MIELQKVTKRFSSYTAIDNVSIVIEQGEIHGIVGASGAGKSTLLRLMNLLEQPDSGHVMINGQTLTKMKSNALREVRKKIGMIFQHFHLVANKTVYNNIEIALRLAGYPKAQRHIRVMECLQFVGLEPFANHYPAQLSGGQKQRVGIARALATEPHVLLCDEPTSALDPHTSNEVLRLLHKINHTLGITIVVVSHDLEVIKSICHRATVLHHAKVFKTVSLTPVGIQASHQSPQNFVEQLLKGGEHDV